jgi:hypothetical protein
MGAFLEEIEVLKSIYDDQITITNVCTDRDVMGNLTYSDPRGVFTLYADILANYPNTSPMVSISCSDRHIAIKKCAANELEKLLYDSIGNVILFSVIEAIKERFADAITDNDTTRTSLLQTRDAENVINNKSSSIHFNIARSVLNVRHGPVRTEQKSSFQSHFSIVHSMEDVHLFRDIVCDDKKVSRATHNIFAYRFTCPSSGVVYHDHDDDGETAAGSRLAEMIRLMRVDNVAVIVSRWFGGVLLGPDRFKLICNSARDVLEEHGYGHRSKA